MSRPPGRRRAAPAPRRPAPPPTGRRIAVDDGAGRHRAVKAARGVGRIAAVVSAVAVVVVSLTVTAATRPGDARPTASDPLALTDPTSAPAETGSTPDAGDESAGIFGPLTESPDPTEPTSDAPTGDPTEDPTEDDAADRPGRPGRADVEVPQSGPGTFAIARGDGEPAAGATTYTVEIEDGLPFAPGDTARRVTNTLEDERSWQPIMGVDLERVDADGDFRILVASPDTVDALCAPLDTMGQVSCRNGDNVVLNALRWADGIPDYEGRLGTYRRYLVNHEVGHYLGHSHVPCPGPGEPAPVMMQQTYGLGECTGNPWPSIG